MIISSPEVKRTIDDYDILFDSGFVMPISIDRASGDTISFDDKAVLIYLAPKPSSTNPDKFLPSEDITIFPSHIISIAHRTKEVTELSPNEKEGWRRLLAHPTIQ